MPGLRALNKGRNAGVSEVSCAGPGGDCAAVGSYADGRGHSRGFAVAEKNGVWGRAAEVPGPGALNKGGDAEVGSVSCALAGNCAAAGTYASSRGRWQQFAVTERNGRWERQSRYPAWVP